MEEFETYLKNIGKSAKTARNYSGTIVGPISQWAMENGLIECSIAEIEDLVDFEKVARGIRQLEIYLERNRVGNGMYNAALNAFSQFLSNERGAHLDIDLETILKDDSTSVMEKKFLVSTRLGQGKFRNKLIEYWQGCAATGYRGKRLLVASHIKPWRLADREERLDLFNGLLLVPNLDKAFDLGYIAFNSSGRVCVSTELEEPSVLGVHAELRIELERRHQDYLAFHRAEIFRA